MRKCLIEMIQKRKDRTNTSEMMRMRKDSRERKREKYMEIR